MLSELCSKITQNKNLLMLLSVFIYVLALISVLFGHLFLCSTLITIIFIGFLLKNYFPIKYVLVWCLIFYLGVVNTHFRIKETDDLLNLAPVNCEIEGTIISIPQGKAEGKPKFFFDVDKVRINSFVQELEDEKVLVHMNGDKYDIKDLRLYNSGKLNGRLSVPFKAGNPSQFDYGDYMRNHSAYAVFYAKTFTSADKDKPLKAKFLQGVNDYRENILSIHSKYLPSPNLEILGGIVFGDDAVSPPKSIKNSFVNSGLLHILAASGMNVAFIYGFFFYLTGLLKIPFKVRTGLGMIMVLVYSLMTGLGASVVRATAMLLFVLAGKLIDRDAHSISLLSFVAFLMLLYNPLWINDVGFQLSFIVTFGILLMSPLVIRFNHKIKDFIASTIAIPIIAQLWVIPVQIFYFNNISLYSVFANIMSVPILMVLSFGGFISSLIGGIKPIADIVCRVFDFILNPLISLLVNISDFWGSLPNATHQTSHPSIIQIILYYGILLTLVAFAKKDFRDLYLRKLLILVSVLVFLLGVTFIPIKNNNLEIIAFDVGNADAFLIKTPANEYMMIDTGKNGYNGGKSQAEIIIRKYLLDRGINKLDKIVISHFDNDHCGGAVDLMKGLNVSEIYVNDLNHNSFTAKSIYKTAKTKGVNLILAEDGKIIYDNNGIMLVNFVPQASENDNENSIITLLEYGDFRMLFTGDSGVSQISNLLNKLPKDITVLKVPHHGAKDGVNSEIISYLNPKISLISVGENKFGHPNMLTLEYLKNTKILRTDINNSIKLVVKKKKLKIFEYDLKRKKYITLSYK